MVNTGVAEHGFHFSRQRGRNHASGLQHVIETRDLQGRGPVREVVQGVAQGFAALAVGPTHPQAAVLLGVVEAIARGLQQVGQVVHANPSQHFGRGAVGRHADHAGERVAGGRVELHIAGLDAGEGPQENGDLGQARGIHHVVGVECGKARVLRIGDVGQRY